MLESGNDTSTSRADTIRKFHHEKPTPCRATYPHFENELGDPFDGSVRSNLTKLPSLPFLVPAILEALVKSAEYSDITEVVPGEADLWCSEFLRQHTGLVLTGDSDLLVHDIGPNGTVSFLSDVQRAPGDSSEGLQSYIYRPASITERLSLPKPHGLRSLAFEISMDTYITFPKLLKQAQASEAIVKHPMEFKEFLTEYVQISPKISDSIRNSADVKSVLKRLDPRVSEYVLQSPNVVSRDDNTTLATGSATEAHIFLPFILDCPVNTSAWESSISVRQLAYSLINLVADRDEQISSVFEHRKQVDTSNGRELQLIQGGSISDACDALLSHLLQLKNKLPGLGECHVWTAWSIDQDESSLGTLVIRQFSQIERFPETRHFTWNVIRFFAELQASHYSFRILRQMLDVVIAITDGRALPRSILSLHAELQSIPDLTRFPSLMDASSAIRKVGDQDTMAAIKHIVQTLTLLPVDTEIPCKDAKKMKKRKGDTQVADASEKIKKPTNIFELLSSE